MSRQGWRGSFITAGMAFGQDLLAANEKPGTKWKIESIRYLLCPQHSSCQCCSAELMGFLDESIGSFVICLTQKVFSLELFSLQKIKHAERTKV